MSRHRNLTIGAVLLAVVAMVSATGVTTAPASADSGELVAYFADAGSLIAGNTVRAGGIVVGSVRGVALDRGRARVDMELDPSALPLHTDASAKIRPVSLLGEQYVSLDSGSPRAPVMSAPLRIAQNRTSTSVDVQDLINTLDTPTSTALASLVTTLGEGMHGNAANVASAIKALRPAMTNASTLATILRQQNGLLDKLIDRASPVAAAVAADDGHTIDSLVQAADKTLGTVSSQRQQLSSAVAQLPQTLGDARQVLAQLGGVADAATPALRSARPVTDNLSAISDELREFTAAGTPALGALGPVLDRANSLLDEARPVVSQLSGASGTLRSVAASARPIGTAALGSLENLLKFVTGWALATAGYDAIGHFFRADVPIDANTIKTVAPDLVPSQLLGGQAPGSPGTQGAAAKSAPPQSDSGAASGETRSGPTRSGSAQPGTAQSESGRQPPVSADPTSATGLTQQQENSVQQLIFGGQ
ncbi:MlaD family protein [Sciscionella marina]|uniref:MlaD family protein n=1 Tax=Sciscionella marina TaxID=508770 RepID=UPI000378DBA3|nr:MlaD family protein [Sciscionella marina]